MSNFAILGCIVFFLTLGILLGSPAVPRREADAMLLCCRALLRCCMKGLMWLVWWTPVGMASLMCVSIASMPNLASLMQALGLYVVCVALGHSIHVGVVYPLLFLATTGGNGWRWMRRIYEVPVFVFMINSSAATLPRSLQVADKVGLSKDVYHFILPLDCAINVRVCFAIER